MPKYTVEQKSSWGGKSEVHVKREPTAGEMMQTVGALALVLGARAVTSYQEKMAEKRVSEAAKLIEQGEYEQALDKANELIGMRDKLAKAAGYFIKGGVMFTLEDYDQAIEEFSTSIKTNFHPEMVPLVIIHRAESYLRKNDLRNALQDFSQAMQLSPQEETGYYGRGIALRQLREFDQALIDFKRAIDVNPSNYIIYLERGHTYADMGKTKQALEDYSRAITLAPKNPENYQWRGTLYLSMENYNQAIADYTQALTLDPQNIKLHRLCAKAYHQAGHIAKSMASQAIVKQLAKEELLQQAYNDYLREAMNLYTQGIRKIYTEADSKTKKGMGTGCFTIIVTIICFLITMCITLSWLRNSVINNYDLYIKQTIVFLPIFVIAFYTLCIMIIFSYYIKKDDKIKEHNKNVRYAKSYLDTKARMPGFEAFFNEYLQAIKTSKRRDLATITRPLFEAGGPAHGAVQAYQKQS